MKYGLDDNYFDKLTSVFPRHPEVESVVLYGSRAKGNYKPFSDIDITLKGASPVNFWAKFSPKLTTSCCRISWTFPSMTTLPTKISLRQ